MKNRDEYSSIRMEERFHTVKWKLIKVFSVPGLTEQLFQVIRYFVKQIAQSTYLLFFSWDRELCSWGWPGTCYAAQDGLKLISSLFCFPSAGVAGLHPHSQPNQFFILCLQHALYYSFIFGFITSSQRKLLELITDNRETLRKGWKKMT